VAVTGFLDDRRSSGGSGVQFTSVFVFGEMFVVEQRGTQFGDRGRGRVGVVGRGGAMLLLLVVVIVVVVVAAAVGGGGGVVGGGDDTGCGGDGADVVRCAVSPLSAPR